MELACSVVGITSGVTKSVKETKLSEANETGGKDFGSRHCSTACTHRLTIYLDHAGINSNITTDTNTPDIVQRQITDAMDEYYRFRWWMRRKTFLLMGGTPVIAIPIEKVLCFKIEPIRP